MLEDVEAIRVTITLGRKLLGVLLNVFVPTTILNLIGFSTNFYKVTDNDSLCYDETWLLTAIKIKIHKTEAQDAYFESVIAINLTSMLVLVALFVQVFEGSLWLFLFQWLNHRMPTRLLCKM